MARKANSLAWRPRERPVVFITQEAKERLDAYVAVAKGEIAGLGEVSLVSPNTFLIQKVYILTQKTTYSDAELDPGVLMDFVQEWMTEGKDLSKIKLQWHSHAAMGTFWSKTDADNIETFDNGTNDWMLSVEANKQRDYVVRLDIFHPLRVTIGGLTLEVLPQIDPELLEAIRAEVAEKVTFTVPEPVKLGKAGVQVIYLPVEGDEYAESVE